MISWFARNPVAANLLMAVILIGGFVSLMNLRTEGFPSLPPKAVTVTVIHEAGSAEANEEAIALKIEEVLRGVEGIKKITSTSTAESSTIRVEKTSGYSLQVLSENVRSKVSGVILPGRAERPIVEMERWQELVASVQVTGDVPVDVMRDVAKMVRARLQADPEIPYVTTGGMRTPEINITIKDDVLQAYGLTLKDVADRVGAFSVTYGNGEVKGSGKNFTVKADRQAYYLRDFENIEIVSEKDGAKVFLSDIAHISDGFTETRIVSRFQDKPSIGLYIQMIGNADLVPAAKRAKEIIAQIEAENILPEGVQLDLWNDASGYIADRLSLMMKNAAIGVGLVFLFLALFLNLRVAFWVAMGLPAAFAGTFILMGDMFNSMTINELTTFGFIIALGIVVDDAVVIGESVYAAKVRALKDKTMSAMDATLDGVHKVAQATVFGVLTTVAAFFPITLIEGELAEIFAVFAWVVVFALLFSIVESKLILPAHLAHIPVGDEEHPTNFLSRGWKAIQDRFGDLMAFMNERLYQPALKSLISFRYASIFAFIAVFIFVLGMVPTGQLRMVFFPHIPSDTIVVSYTGVSGLSPDRLFAEADRIELAAKQTDTELREKYGRSDPLIVRLETVAIEGGDVLITAELAPRSSRKASTNEIAQNWQDRVGDVEGADKLNFASTWEGDDDLSISLVSNDKQQLQLASEELVAHLSAIDGISNLRNSMKSGKPRVRLDLRDEAKSLGVTVRDIATQLYGALAGYEVQRIQRGEDEVKVRVRLPRDERADLSALNELNIRVADGSMIAVEDAAIITPEYAADSITRVNYQRVAEITASTDKFVITGTEIVNLLEQGFFQKLKNDYPGLSVKVGGEVEEEQQAMKGFMLAFGMALIAIFALLAIPLKSYYQPLIIMAAIPFGVVGAFLGHWVNDLPISILSINGILALSGVVVNDSLLLVSAYNRNREKGMSVNAALMNAGHSRFRAVILTSVTTFAGLAPLIMETSEQAQFLIPAAIALGYGILFATVITLVLIPVLIYIVEDLKRLFVTTQDQPPVGLESEST